MADGSPDTPARTPLGGASRSWIAWLLVGSFAALLLFRPGTAPTVTLPYSELKARIAAGQIAEVKLSKDRIVALPKAPPAAAAAPGKAASPAQRSTAAGPARLTANRVDDPSLVPLLDAQHVPYSGTSDDGWLGGLFVAWVLPLGALAAFYFFLMRRMKPGAGVMSIGRSRAKLVPEEGTGITFADVAGVDEAVDELREIVDFLQSPERFQELGGRIPKGVLLVGPPGTGKTLLGRAVAGEAKVPFFALTGSDFVEMFVGVGAARVRDLFQQAQAKAPCIIFIDELDAIGKARGVASSFAGHDEREQTLNQLLAEMDGFDARKGLIIMAATNRPEILDPALLRPGRFDREVLVDRPDVRGREAILRIHARGVKMGLDVDLATLAAITPGLAGAELANVINEAALLAARRRAREVGMADVNEAVERVVAGLEKKNRRMNPREKEIVAHHEAGHALLAQVLPTTDRVHKVSMIPRGMGALGYTMQRPLEDRYLLTRPELVDRITVLMGGHAAEQMVFGENSTGAQDDLERATALARRMVVQFGMSQRLGPQALGPGDPTRERPFPGLMPSGERTISERTHQIIDAEVGDLLRLALRRATAYLVHNREPLLRLARRLRDQEVIEGEELAEILGDAQAPPIGDHNPAERPEHPFATH